MIFGWGFSGVLEALEGSWRVSDGRKLALPIKIPWRRHFRYTKELPEGCFTVTYV